MTTYEAANAYLETRFIPALRKRFAVAAELTETAFMPIAKREVERGLALRFERVVAADHTHRLHDHVLSSAHCKNAASAQRVAHPRPGSSWFGLGPQRPST